MTKCDICNKGITTKVPGLECRSCGKVVHASKACSGLNAKQLSALRNADRLDWTCEECHQNTPNRKSSFIIPEEDDEDNDVAVSDNSSGNCMIDTEKFLKDITAEMKKVLKKELQPIEASVSFCCTKIDDLSKIVEAQNKHIQELEKKYNYLHNEKTHLELEMSSLKQYLRNIEQQRLDNVIEVIGIPKAKDENLVNISLKLAETLNMDRTQVVNTTRVEGRNNQDGNIQVQFKHAENVSLWVRASKKEAVVVEQIITEAPVEVAKTKVIIRRALTKANKSLLWLAQQKLRPAYKYVWFQDGKVLLRKDDKSKPKVARSEADIEKLSALTEIIGQSSKR
ncbi:unnamed protein product [Parnassius apollo]|uniref:(apollo) hypothetical protein n=1 Tax=Parnassius apollo TaxID=110799 RepID=A0A8S3XRH8_PARAO|nr:unnamed protein product [Parnassius apollo]